MVLELIATGLLAYGVASRSVNSFYEHTNVSNDNNIVERLSEPQYANTFNNRVTGLYNFKNTINFYDWFNDAPSEYSYTIWFDEEELGTCPISIGNQNNEFLISIYFELTNDAVDVIYLDFYTYDMYGAHNSYELYFNEIIAVEDLDYPSLFFNYTSSLILSDYDYEIFDLIFTHDDNDFIVSYSGYYNFLTNSSLRDGDKYSILGSIVYNNIICNGLYFQRQGTLSYVYFINYSVEDSKNIVNTVTFENFRSKTNILLSGVKMDVDFYTELSTIGVFSYVRDTRYDDTDFHDLLFTIMDTPIYFFSRLFDFQFFGVNLYIALSGLITLAVVVIIIRKIW